MADITGYTRFLNESELEHAQQSLVAILEVVAGSTKAPLVINRIVGDAAISYGFDEEILNLQTLVDVLENVYVVYRRALEQMVLNTTCRCNACANLGSLDLKFIVHHGEFSIREMAGNMELIGPDVNLVFRLAKNTIKERLGIGAYIAYSDSATDALGIDGFVPSLQTLIEDVDDFAQVTIHVADMHQTWERRRYESLVSIPDGDVMLSFTRDIHALCRSGVGSPDGSRQAGPALSLRAGRHYACRRRDDGGGRPMFAPTVNTACHTESLTGFRSGSTPSKARIRTS